MKKTVILTVCMLLVTSAYADEKLVVASAAIGQTPTKHVVAKRQIAPKASKKPAPVDYSGLEAFACCGLPQ